MTDHPDAASWTIPADQVQTVSINPPTVITINGTDGQPMVSIHPDGRIEYGPDYQPDEAARVFWDALQRWYPGNQWAATSDGEACRSTQHCAHHGFCHRCAPELAALGSRINVAIQRSGVGETHWGPLYEAVMAVMSGHTRGPVRKAKLEGPMADVQFGSPDCTCIPWTRQGGTPRYCGPHDTVDMIGGWERGRDCPHHAPAPAPEPGLREQVAAALWPLTDWDGDVLNAEAAADAALAVRDAELQQLRAEVQRQIDAKVGIGRLLGNALADKTVAESQLAALKRAHIALAEQAGKDQAALARVREFADQDQDGLCCSHVTGELRTLLKSLAQQNPS